MDYTKLCMRCMKKSDDIGICPYCGKEKAGSKTWSKALAPGTILNRKLLIGNILGKGGYGITYIGYDTLLEYPVAIKEFFPDEMVDRADDGVTVTVLDEVNKEEYQLETEAYLREARVLAEFSKFPGIVSIKDMFYENNTGYLIMEFLDSGNMRKYIDAHGGWLGVKESLELMEPVISILGKLHAAGLIHRDISPDNIMIDQDGVVKLIDFGGSKRLGVSSTQVFLGKWGFAPLEQMLSKISEQGPWTDIYGICATLYCMMTGDVPQSSYERNEKDELVDIANYTITIETHIAKAIMKGLSMDARNRQQSIDELYKDLYGIYPDEKGQVSVPKEASVEILRERSGRVWFGEYPMNEVTGASVTSDIIYADYDEHDTATVGEKRYLRLAVMKDVINSGLGGMIRPKIEQEITGYRYFEFTKLPWRIVEQNKKRITLQSEYIIDFRPYDDPKYLKMNDRDIARVRSGIFWEKSKIREWLNSVFVKRAFTDLEKAKLQMTPINTPVSALSDRTTYDKVYLPSIEEIRYGFDKNTSLQRGTKVQQLDENSPCSQYVGAMANGSLANASYALRSRGHIELDGSYKVQEGFEGHAIIGGKLSPWQLNREMGIRPVICVSLDDITDMA